MKCIKACFTVHYDYLMCSGSMFSRPTTLNLSEKGILTEDALEEVCIKGRGSIHGWIGGTTKYLSEAIIFMLMIQNVDFQMNSWSP